ncbi:MAG: hypothetical protein AB7V42_11030 [Thermoleophilia bacterium]
MSGWQTVRLGDFLAPVRDPISIVDGHEYTQITVRIKGRGLALRRRAKGSEIATKRQFLARTGQLLVSKIDARNGGLGLVPPELDGGIVSGDFPVFDIDGAVCQPEYLELVVSRTEFWDECLGVSEGSTNRVRLVPEQFLDLEVDVPPLTEQARIVGAVDVLRRQASATTRLRAACAQLYRAAREERIEEPDWDRALLSDVITSIAGGRSPKCHDRPPAEGEWGVLKVSAIRDGEFRPAEAKALPAEIQPTPRFAVRRGDLLYSRANTAQLVGAMCRIERDFPRLLLCDKTMRVTLDEESVSADYLVHATGVLSVREQVEIAAGGTSESMKNISQPAFLDVEISLPPVGEQHRISRELSAMRTATQLLDDELGRLGGLRSALVEELVSGLRPAPPLRSAA